MGNPEPIRDVPTKKLVDYRSSTAVGELDRVRTRRLVLKFRREGASAGEIVEKLAACDPPIEMTEQKIYQLINDYLRAAAEHDAASVEDLRRLENERLDKLWEAYYQAAIGDPHNPDPDSRRPPNMKAANFLLSLSARRAKMNGLDAAAKVEHFGKIGHLHELGVDPEEVARSERAFRDTYRQPGIEPPDIIDATEVKELA